MTNLHEAYLIEVPQLHVCVMEINVQQDLYIENIMYNVHSYTCRPIITTYEFAGFA